jgi:hypothetical protein
MTTKEAKALAKELIGQKKFIEAGFVLTMLHKAPADTPKWAVDDIRHVFFIGARYMFDLLHMPLTGGDRAVGDLLDNLLAEFKKFREDHHDKTSH